MRDFLIRLFNLPPAPKPECPSCNVYKQWLQTEQSDRAAEFESMYADITDLRRQLDEVHAKLEDSRQAENGRLQRDKEAERQERQNLEDTVLKYVRIKPGVPGPVKVVTPAEGQPQVRPGTNWNIMRRKLEEEGRKKAEHYKNKEEAEIKAGRMAPETKDSSG